MNITALIKISAEIPHGAISQATGEYLLSMAKAEREHNARVAFLSERGSRVASQPSEYWQRALAIYKYARQGRPADHYLYVLDQSSSSLSPDLHALEPLVRIASESESFSVLLKMADEGQVTKSDLVQEDRTQARRQKTKKQKGKGKREQAQIDRKTKGKKGRQLLNRYYAMIMDDGTDPDMVTKIFKRINSMVGKGGSALRKMKDQNQLEWRNRQNEPVEYTIKGAKGNDLTKSTKLKNMRDWEKIKNPETQRIYKKIWEEEYGKFVKTLFNLAKRAVAGGGGSSPKKEEGAKADGAPEKDQGSGSEGSKKEKPKTDAEKAKDFIEGADSPEQKKERQELVKEKGIDGAEAITFGGDQEEEESATGESLTNVGEVSAEKETDDGAGRGKGNKGKKNKGQGKRKRRSVPQVGPRGTPQQFQNPSAGKVRAMKASEEDFLSSESPSDYSSTDFDIIF